MTRKMLIKAHVALPMNVMPVSSWGAPSFLSKEDFASAGGPPDFATPTLLHCFAGHSALRLTRVLQNVQNYFPLLSIVPVKENKKVRFGMFQHFCNISIFFSSGASEDLPRDGPAGQKGEGHKAFPRYAIIWT